MDGSLTPANILERMAAAAHDAGELALRHFRDGEKTSAGVSYKDGGSPVTEADLIVDRFLEQTLRRLLPDAGYLSEEGGDDLSRLRQKAVFIVDPIDGTRAFMRGDRRWAVSVALVADGQPIHAVLRAPALDQTFAAGRGLGATMNGAPIAVSAIAQLEGARIAAPKKILERLRQSGLLLREEGRIPSLAYRLAQVARGALDIGLASENAHDWDIAAADLILREAGGTLCDAFGKQQAYNGSNVKHGLLAAANAKLIPDLLSVIRKLDPEAQAS